MSFERQRFINAERYQRSGQRVDQANGYYPRGLTTRLGVMELKVPRTRSGHFHPQVLVRYQRREPAINTALKEVFLLGVSTRQTGHALASLVEEAVSAATVSAVAKALDSSVLSFHRRRLGDHYRYLILDGVSVRIRLVGKVQRRRVLCAYGVTRQGQRELIDFQIVQAEGEDTWYGFLWGLWSRGLHGEFLELIATDGHPGLISESYAVDNNVYPTAETAAALTPLVQPIYIKTMPNNDGWGRAFQVASTTTLYTIHSFGKDGSGATCTAATTTSFNDEICFSNGQFIRYPEGSHQ